jgi:DNA-directed RNA polymerase subunit RPC12/RpoP
MSATLDSFFSGLPVPQSTATEPRCFKCGRTIPDGETKFTLPIKGKPEEHCRICAKKILQPQENTEEAL